MQKHTRPFLILTISLLMVFISVAFQAFGSASTSSLNNYTGGILIFQTTATPTAQEEDQSVIGSTDSITVMSFVIVAIIIIPILVRRKSWSQP